MFVKEVICEDMVQSFLLESLSSLKNKNLTV